MRCAKCGLALLGYTTCQGCGHINGTKRQISYMIFQRPVSGGKTWTRTPDKDFSGFAHANLFHQKDSADHASSCLEGNHPDNYYTVFECREVGFTATISDSEI